MRTKPVLTLLPYLLDEYPGGVVRSKIRLTVRYMMRAEA
jgi:hypothetical protein